MQPIPMPPKPPMADAMVKTFTVPLEYLAQPDDGETMQTPAKGDIVEAQVTLTVDDIQGENAICSPTAINGKDLESPDSPAEKPEDGMGGAPLDEQESGLREAMAQETP